MDGAVTRDEPVLKGAAARDRRLAGGKGAVLAELAAAFPVPPFFVVPPSAFGPEGLAEPVRRAVEAAVAELGDGPFAVRSSGVEEDGASAAHAGQFETRLNVPAKGVVEACCAVWRSGFSETLAEYRRAHGLGAEPQPPAVVVQRMVRADAAGVTFTADPVTGERDVVVVSAVAGLADRLVAGEVDGDVWRLGRDGRVLDRTLQGRDPVLSPAQAAAVAALARRAEAHFGAPQDVEWAIEGETLQLLQARPITTLRPDEDLSIWDNSNIVESYPGVVSPLTFSFARRIYGHVYRAFCGLMGVDEAAIAENRAAFDTLLGRAHGRVYYNLLGWYRLLSLFPGFKANRAFMEQMMGVGEALPPDLASKIAPPVEGAWPKALDRLRLLRVAGRLAWNAVVLPGVVRRFQARLDAALVRSDAEIEALSATTLAAEFRSLEAQLLERWDAPLINDFLCMIAFGASRKALEKWAGADGLALHSDVMIGQGDIVSAEPARRIREMGRAAAGRPDLIAQLAAGDRAVAEADPALGPMVTAYLDKFGDRCTEELKLESLTLHEDPRALLAAVAAAAGAPVRERAESAGAEARLAALFAGRPVKRALTRGLLAWAKARVRDRENLRFERTRLFGRVRRIVRAGGRRLVEAGALAGERDVFLLTVEEWLGALEGGGVDRDLKGLVALRRAEEAADRQRPDPPERFEIRGAFLPGLERLRASASVPDLDDEASRRGQACCAGIVTARVRVIADPRLEALEAGEILVARHTDPGWIAVFANASGVIAERGSLLSHSAIVAREMGVPCVVALKGATEWLRTGDLVRLDGGTGVVERLEG
jgi:pyruvate,water dikinase